MITIFTARPSARLILPIALLFLSLACGEDKTAGPEATGSLVIVAGFAEWATLEDQSAISQMVFTVSREGQTITTRPLQFEGRRWSAELELPVGRIDVRVEAFVGDVMTRHATVNVEVQRALSREVVVRLAWVVPERLQVRAPDGIYTAPPVVEISWQFSDNDHWRGFVVARREVGEGEFAALPLGASPDSVTISSRTYYDSTVVYPRAYEYRVAAMDTSGVLGDWSETIAVEISVQATELPPPPPPPPGRLDHVRILTPSDDLDLSAISSEIASGSWLAIQKDDVVTVMRPDGSDASYAGDGSMQAWSPDSSRLAIKQGRSAYYYEATTGQTVHLFDDGFFRAWSPDGAQVAFLRNSQTAWVHDLATSTSTQIALGEPLGWSPDGNWLCTFWYEDPNSHAHISLLPTSGGEPVPKGRGRPLSFSPDGRWLMYYGGWHFTGWHYRIVSVAGEEDRLLATSYDATMADWAPDSRQFVCAAPGWRDISHVTIDGEELPLASGGGGTASWSPSGDLISFSLPDDWDLKHEAIFIHTIRPDGTDEVRVSQTVSPGAMYRTHDWSPDGQFIVTSVPDDSPAGASLYLISPETGARARIGEWGSKVLWSPVGEW